MKRTLFTIVALAALTPNSLFAANNLRLENTDQRADSGTLAKTSATAARRTEAPKGIESPLTFIDATSASGLDFVHSTSLDHQSGPMTGGGAAGDFNGDGYADLFVLGGGGRADALFINNGDGTFSDKAEEWNLASPHRGVGVATGDYDNDGDLDIYVTSFGFMNQNAGHGKHMLFRNEGDHFVNVATAAGVATTTTTHPDGYGAAFGDYDRDGDLDLFVGAWHNSPVLGARLFNNQGDGTFVNATNSAGIIKDSTRAFGAIWTDMDGDHFPELLIPGDFGTNRYYRNNTDGTFTELDPGSGLASDSEAPPNWTISKAHNAMGTTVGDFNRDGRPDWFITAIWPTANFDSDFWGNGLYINQGNHTFTENAAGYGVSDGGWGWGSEAADFDNDGWTDLVMTNGWPFADNVTNASFDNERSYLWRNRGDLTFEEIGAQSGLDHIGEGRTLLTLDYDRDGDMDIVLLSYKEGMKLYRNEHNNSYTSPETSWLQVVIDTTRYRGRAPHGLGARITVEADGIEQTRYIKAGGSYLGQSEQVIHFGLGNSKRIQKLTIDWGDGKSTVLQRVRINERLRIRSVPTLPGR
ncbi:MAG: CRTAC1 family protein [Gammaproteobacteria bacterium]